MILGLLESNLPVGFLHEISNEAKVVARMSGPPVDEDTIKLILSVVTGIGLLIVKQVLQIGL